jgi:hypothetical protein
MDDFNSESDSDYTSYWRDWVRTRALLNTTLAAPAIVEHVGFERDTSTVSTTSARLVSAKLLPKRC